MRIFFVCFRVPFPPDRGDKIITFNLVRHLSRNHEVHVFCLGDGKADLGNIRPLAKYAASVTAHPFKALPARLRAGWALLSGRPLSVAMLNEKRLLAAIGRKFAELPPDLILAVSSNVAQFAAPFAETPRIMHFIDLDSLKWKNYADRSAVPMKWLYAIEHRRLLAYERRIAHSFSHSLVCTEPELEDLRRLMPDARASRLGNGVDLDFFKSKHRPKRRGTIVFTGVMDYLPNADAVDWFCGEIFPAVREQCPEARFVICGSNPSVSVQALGTRPGVIVTGRVPDVRPFLDEAALAVVPIRIARGIQNKVLEAMAMGLPCVSCTPAWRGTEIAKDDGIVVADEPGEFAAAVARLLQDDSYRAEMAQKARAAVERQYEWESQLRRLDALIDEVTARPHAAIDAGARFGAAPR